MPTSALHKVHTGIDQLRRRPRLVQGRRIGLVTNPTGVARDVTPTLYVVARAPGARLVALFGPEHGASGAVQDGLPVASGVDASSGLRVYSLYGERKRPTREMLDGIDLLIYDIQDVGVRFYTYVYTLAYVMEAAAECGVEVMVLDRPNPIGGERVEGPVLEPEYASFIGRYPIPVRYGLTVGELAQYLNDVHAIGCDLTVVRMGGWTRDMWHDATGLPWIAPSPNIATLATCEVYPGTCLFEGTNMSEGRGTAHPFEWIGAPWADGRALAAELNARGLPGVRFRETHFAPTFSKHTGVDCAGVQPHVTDRYRLRPFEMGLHMIDACLRLFPHDFEFLPTSWEGRPPHFDLLTGNGWVREAILSRTPIQAVAALWQPGLRAFERARRRFVAY